MKFIQVRKKLKGSSIFRAINYSGEKDVIFKLIK